MSIAQLSQKTLEQAETFGKEHGFDAKTSFQILAEAGVSTKDLFINKALPRIGVDTKGLSEASANELYQDAQSFAEKSGFTANHQSLMNATKNENVNSADEQGKRYAHTFSTLAEQAQHHQHQIEKHTQHAQQYSHAADRVEHNAISIDHNMDQKFVDFVADQKLVSGHARGRSGALYLIHHSPEECNAALHQFLDQERPRFMTALPSETFQPTEKPPSEQTQEPLNYDATHRHHPVDNPLSTSQQQVSAYTPRQRDDNTPHSLQQPPLPFSEHTPVSPDTQKTNSYKNNGTFFYTKDTAAFDTVPVKQTPFLINEVPDLQAHRINVHTQKHDEGHTQQTINDVEQRPSLSITAPHCEQYAEETRIEQNIHQAKERLTGTYDQLKTDIQEEHFLKKTALQGGAENMKQKVETESKRSSLKTAVKNIPYVKEIINSKDEENES